jgi:D-alanine-D-alanine ligase
MARKSMSERSRIAILMGGRSGEHDVSLETGRGVLEAIDRDAWEPVPVVISSDNQRWRFGRPDRPEEGEALDLPGALARLSELRVRAAFIAMHGPFGEDGRVQALLDWLDIPHTGSDVATSALAMDKPHAKDVYRTHGIPTPRYEVLRISGEGPAREASLDAAAARVSETFPAPWVLKTPRLGSSVGIEIIRSRDALRPAIARTSGHDGRVMLEEYCQGREFTAPVLDLVADGEPRALPVIEIVPVGRDFFDYEAKYDGALNREICPAEITPDLEARVRKLGVQAHLALGCRGFSRTDVIVTPGGAIHVLETNTIPGLTGESLFPKSAREAGISYQDLVSLLLQDAIDRS